MAEMPAHQFVYRGRIERVIDGDSLVVTLDLGLGVHLGRGNEGAHLRLLGVDTPERNEPGWREAREFTGQWLFDAEFDGVTVDSPFQLWPLRIKTQKGDAFGRYLADVWAVKSGRHLNDDLLVSGHATPYERLEEK